MNDVPEPSLNVNTDELPMLTEETAINGFFVWQLTKNLYRDTDQTTALGLVVLHAQNSTLGAWQYSDDKGSSWSDVSHSVLLTLNIDVLYETNAVVMF